MSLKINGVSPTKVIVKQNGVDVELTQIDVVKNGSRVTVWTADDPRWIPVLKYAVITFDINEYMSMISFSIVNQSGEYVGVQVKLIGGEMDDQDAITGLIRTDATWIPQGVSSDTFYNTITAGDSLSLAFLPTVNDRIKHGEIESLTLSISFKGRGPYADYHTPLIITKTDFTYEVIDPETTTTTTT